MIYTVDSGFNLQATLLAERRWFRATLQHNYIEILSHSHTQHVYCFTTCTHSLV